MFRLRAGAAGLIEGLLLGRREEAQDCGDQIGLGNGFRKGGVGAEDHGGSQIVQSVDGAGDSEKASAGPGTLDPLNQFEAIAVGHDDIGDDEVIRVSFAEADRFNAGTCLVDTRCNPLQHRMDHTPDGRVVVNEQNAACGRLCQTIGAAT